MATDTSASIVGWAALVISLIALALAWMAFNRTGTDIEAVVEQQINQATEELQAEYRQLEAEFRANTSDELDEAARDLETDEQPTTTGE